MGNLTHSIYFTPIAKLMTGSFERCATENPLRQIAIRSLFRKQIILWFKQGQARHLPDPHVRSAFKMRVCKSLSVLCEQNLSLCLKDRNSSKLLQLSFSSNISCSTNSPHGLIKTEGIRKSHRSCFLAVIV